jgi:cytoplasmic FMR1 interacting protein
MLSEYIQVDPFDDMLSEIDEEASLVAFNGRIVAHTVQELVTDLIPNFCFNSYTERFVRNPVSVAIKEASPPQFAKVLPMHLYGTKHMFLAHNAVHHLFKSFFGQPHLAAIVNLLGPEHMGVILGELIKSTDVMLVSEMIFPDNNFA